jgi:hypothetical protein
MELRSSLHACAGGAHGKVMLTLTLGSMCCCLFVTSVLLCHVPADGRYKGFNHPVVLSCAGLLSAAVSTYKYWGT